MRGTTLSLREAYALLGLHGRVEGPAALTAFRQAVKAARPDQAGGDAERFRRVIEAWRLIQKLDGAGPALAAPKVEPIRRPPPTLILTPLEGLNGCERIVALPDRAPMKVRVPAGLRAGDHVRLKAVSATGEDVYLPIAYRAEDALSVVGDDLWMPAPADPRVLADGGRIEIDTHAGPRTIWIVSGMETPIRLRLKGLGLPARGARRQGHLFVTLTPAEPTLSAVDDMLARFETVWTGRRLAA